MLTDLEMKSYFGDEYPVAIVDGVRMPLVREDRWARYYATPDAKKGASISRFMDGSASITFEDLQREWPAWDRRARIDFCQACSWLHGQPDFPEILRFIMKQGSSWDWSSIAMSVASRLSTEEAFQLLSRALNSTAIGMASNITQGISLTKHPEAETTLRAHLEKVWAHPSLLDQGSDVAFDAVTCIRHLIDIGVSSDEMEERIRVLAQHQYARTRRACRNYFGKHYSWLNSPEEE